MSADRVVASSLGFMAPDESRSEEYRFLDKWLSAGSRLLDVGAGAGGLVGHAANRGVLAKGLDGDPQNVNRAEDRGLDVVCADAFEPDLGDEQFDIVTMIHFIEHFSPPDAARLLKLYAGMLVPGGRLLLMTPNFADWHVASHLFWLDPTHVRPYPAPLLHDMVRQQQLVVEHNSTDTLVDLGRRRRILRPLGRLRFGREFERLNLTVVARRPSFAA